MADMQWVLNGVNSYSNDNTFKKSIGDLFLPIIPVIEELNPDYMFTNKPLITSNELVTGVYRFQTAEGRLVRENITGSKDGRGWGYRLLLKFKVVEDAQILHDLVLGAGSSQIFHSRNHRLSSAFPSVCQTRSRMSPCF